MKVKVFNLSYQAEIGGFDSSEVEAFGEEVEILSLQEHFFMQQERARLVLIVTYQDGSKVQRLGGGSSRSGGQGVRRAGSEGEQGKVSEAEKEMYEVLRRWRGKQAREDGIPAFAVLNNENLVEVIKRKPQTKAELLAIHGIGKASIERYAEALLSFFRKPEVKAARAESPAGEEPKEGGT